MEGHIPLSDYFELGMIHRKWLNMVVVTQLKSCN